MNPSELSKIAAEARAAYENERAANSVRMGKVNVLISGNAGVGKSTLINAVFGSKLAKTGIGAAVTQHIQDYTVADCPLRIFDTRGFEIKGADETVGAVRNKIDALRQSTDPNDQLHIAWTCILEQSHRIEPVQVSFLDMLRDRGVPALVVVTQALGEQEMLARVRDLAVPNNGVIPVLAQEREIAGHKIAPYGAEALVRRTLELLPEAQRSAFIAAQKACFDLKERAAIRAIDAAVALAASSALIPVSGGHSAALVTIQAGLIAQINAALGVGSSDLGGRDVVAGLFGIALAKMGGQTAFTLALGEVLRLFPGAGWVGAAAIGGPVGGAITKMFGHVYLDAIKGSVQRDEPLPNPEALADRMRDLLDRHADRYRP